MVALHCKVDDVALLKCYCIAQIALLKVDGILLLKVLHFSLFRILHYYIALFNVDDCAMFDFECSTAQCLRG